MAMELIRHFLEDISNLKCCIPQRDFGAYTTDDISTMEQCMDSSSSTVVLWSRAALVSKWHKAEVKMARYIELYRHFDFRVIHVFLEDLSDVTEMSLIFKMSGVDHLQWSADESDATETKIF